MVNSSLSAMGLSYSNTSIEDVGHSNYVEKGELVQSRPGHSVGRSFTTMFEDSVLRHPSRWFGSKTEQEPYVSSKGSARGLFVTLTGDGTIQGGNCSDRCDLTLDEAMELLRITAPEYMNFTESLYSFGADLNANRTEQKYWVSKENRRYDRGPKQLLSTIPRSTS